MVKEPACQCRTRKRRRLDPWVGKIPWRRAWQPTPAFLPGEPHGQRSLAGYSPWAPKDSDTTESTAPTQAPLPRPGALCPAGGLAGPLALAVCQERRAVGVHQDWSVLWR